MYMNDLKDFVRMSCKSGQKVDYVQAGGGNTSVKFYDGYMAIKASGCFLRDMTESSGFVAVNGQQIWKQHEEWLESDTDYNKEIMDLAISSIKQVNGESSARPSLEVGFHSLLGKYVLHLHPVYINVLMCSKGGIEKAMEIAAGAGLSAISVPYAMPGYKLTKLIQQEIRKFGRANDNVLPEVVFLKNHGVITHGDTADKALRNMDKIVSAIIKALKLPVFPIPEIKKSSDYYESGNSWMKKILQEEDIAEQLIKYPIYPDQLVYTANELTVGEGGSKIVINNGRILYNTGEKEAIALEETMTALVYMYYCINQLNFEKEVLTQQQCMEVLGGDSEKYRKKLMSGK